MLDRLFTLDFLVSLAVGVSAAAFGVLLVLAAYFVARLLRPHEGISDRTSDLAGNVAFRIAALHGLILGLVYAQELMAYREVEQNLSEEAVAVSDIFNDMRRYGGDSVAQVQGEMALYLKFVVEVEWPKLARREELAAEAWIAWQNAYETLLDLTPDTERQRYLADRMRGRASDIARYRTLRGNDASNRFPFVFWAPTLIGLFLLALPFFVFRPTRTHLALMGVFGAYSGIIMFFIYAFSNPFAQPGRLEPAPFQHLLQGEIGRALPPPEG